jgi:hypothetical protein
LYTYLFDTRTVLLLSSKPNIPSANRSQIHLKSIFKGTVIGYSGPHKESVREAGRPAKGTMDEVHGEGTEGEKAENCKKVQNRK